MNSSLFHIPFILLGENVLPLYGHKNVDSDYKKAQEGTTKVLSHSRPQEFRRGNQVSNELGHYSSGLPRRVQSNH